MVLHLLVLNGDRSLNDLFEEVVNEFDNIEVQMPKVNYIHLKDFLLRYKEPYDVIITGDIPVKEIRAITDKPVFRPEYSGIELLRVLQSVKNEWNRLVIFGYEAFTKIANEIAQLMEYDIQIVTVQHLTQCVEQMNQWITKGYNLFVCDEWTYIVGRLYNADKIPFIVTKESIRETMFQVLAFYEPYRTQKIDSMLTSIIVERNNNDYLILDENNQVVKTNLRDQALIQVLQSIEENKTQVVILDNIYQLEENPLVIEAKRFTYYHLKCKPQEVILHPALSYLTKDQIEQQLVDEPLRSVVVTREVMKELEKVLSTYRQLLIDGAMGTKQSLIALQASIINSSSNRIIVRIDTRLIDDDFWLLLDKLVLKTNDVLLIEGLNYLDTYSLTRLLNWCQSKKQRIIFTSIRTLGLISKIQSFGHCYRFNTKSLVEYHSIETIGIMLLNKYRFGTTNQVIGFKTESVSLMESFHWPENFLQLERVIHYLVAQNLSAYITREQLEKALKYEQQLPVMNEMVATLSSVRPTLNDYIRWIINDEIKRQHGNKAKARANLGIGRSKMERYLSKED